MFRVTTQIAQGLNRVPLKILNADYTDKAT